MSFFLALLLAPGLQPARAADKVTVFAAASLKETLDRLAADWKTQTGKEVTISFAASSALAKQIEQGAPADLFISADLTWMDYLAKADLIDPQSRVNLLGNRIVLITAAQSNLALKIGSDADLKAALGDGRLAMGAVQSVPAGMYGKAALEKLGLWESVKDKIAQADNVRAALLLVSRQEAPLGIVYETDARVDPGVKIIDRFPETSHPPIIYPAALTEATKNPDASAFLTFLQGAKAAEVFKAAGFTMLGEAH
ncbi:molybdate ABC transporter substrate-binding protein [Rhizobium paknamense]|uniref:Molybdate transport system substrate-binding protein n=1 Tax=Rhizobium paknamense TaxID=1206817 RepID=A0ABU0I9Z9_9HYPH|nr:molybdate ABC transporter substrate-binding protein [Rhizobium paknamense]MDQ0455037.1 molybdate transport system substrate-binding protein [Rhizobium paknamense]